MDSFKIILMWIGVPGITALHLYHAWTHAQVAKLKYLVICFPLLIFLLLSEQDRMRFFLWFIGAHLAIFSYLALNGNLQVAINHGLLTTSSVALGAGLVGTLIQRAWR